MIKNIGNIDRLIRLILGVVLITLPYVTQFEIWQDPVWRWVVPVVGLVSIGTAFFRFCLLYRILGINSCKK